jgi:hypothetical protein
MAEEIVLKCQIGSWGGAPPNRSFRVTQEKEITVKPSDMWETVLQKLRATGANFAGTSASLETGTKVNENATVAANGLKNGSVLRFWNGMMD